MIDTQYVVVFVMKLWKTLLKVLFTFFIKTHL